MTFCCWLYSFVCQVPKGDLYAQVCHCPISLAQSTATSSYTFNRGCISHFLSSVLLIDLRGDMMLDVMLSSTHLPGCHTISAWIVMTRRVLSFEVVAYVLFCFGYSVFRVQDTSRINRKSVFFRDTCIWGLLVRFTFFFSFFFLG